MCRLTAGEQPERQEIAVVAGHVGLAPVAAGKRAVNGRPLGGLGRLLAGAEPSQRLHSRALVSRRIPVAC
jgi:hypothetical protein